jgi:hypothetical protein
MGTVVSAVIGAAWKIKGWVDNVAATDQRLAQYILKLDETLKQSHAENQRRFRSIEKKLDTRP